MFVSAYHRHVSGFLGELPVHHELDVVVLELVLEGGHVVAVLLPVLGQGGHLGPAQSIQGLDVGKPGQNHVC